MCARAGRRGSNTRLGKPGWLGLHPFTLSTAGGVKRMGEEGEGTQPDGEDKEKDAAEKDAEKEELN